MIVTNWIGDARVEHWLNMFISYT